MAPSVRARRSPARGARVYATHTANGAVRAQLVDLQRARLLSAMFDVAAERGAANVSVAHVVARSGVSRRTFYEIFDDREDCFLAAYEHALELCAGCVLPAYSLHRKWREQIRAGLGALLSFLDEEPPVGRLLIAEPHAGGCEVQARREELFVHLTQAIGAGCAESRIASPQPLVAEAIAGGVLSIIRSRLLASEREPLIGLLNPLMSMIVLPYLGAAAAQRELRRTLPAGRQRQDQLEPLVADPFKAAGMRLTYRTVRVLMAIVDNPGASNRTIGVLAGMKDQGQTSKLLGRLERIGLVSNAGLGPASGTPNSWSLTVRGHQVVHTIRSHTEGAL